MVHATNPEGEEEVCVAIVSAVISRILRRGRPHSSDPTRRADRPTARTIQEDYGEIDPDTRPISGIEHALEYIETATGLSSATRHSEPLEARLGLGRGRDVGAIQRMSQVGHYVIFVGGNIVIEGEHRSRQHVVHARRTESGGIVIHDPSYSRVFRSFTDFRDFIEQAGLYGNSPQFRTFLLR